MHRLWFALLFTQMWVATSIAVAQPPSIGNCSVFPADNIWNTPVDRLPVFPNSGTYINTIGAGVIMHADFGSGLWAGGPIGIPYITVPGTQTKYPATFLYWDESDPGPYAIPLNAPIEGGSQSSGDRHTIAIDTDNCILYELGRAFPQTSSWQADAGAIFNLLSNALRPATWTSTDAAGLPIFAGLVRYDEIAAGEIRHAIRFTVPQTQRAYIWPARHYASNITDPTYPPMGLRVRLRASYDISGFSTTNQIILRALKKYGMILADNGSAWYISGTPDPRWDNNDLHNLGLIAGSDFEVVDVSSLMIDPNSGQANQSSPGNPPTVHIDTPLSGSILNGGTIISGWAIDNVSAVGTAISSVQVNIDGVPVGAASYGVSRPDVCSAYPGRMGCPNVGFSYPLNLVSLSTGPHTISISATDTDGTPDVGTASVTVTVANQPPSVYIDSPRSVTPLSGVVTVSGWALDNTSAMGTAIRTVQVKVDGTLVGTANYGVPRPDVCAVYSGRVGCPNVGFSYALNTATLTVGTHTITVTATDTDISPDIGLASTTVTVASLPPSVRIDSPAPASMISGVTTIAGWAIDNISTLGTAISSVQVSVDGHVVGTASYGVARPDVCTAYPARSGCPNVGYSYALNTSGLTPGLHTISVLATNSNAVPVTGSSSITITVGAVPPAVHIDLPTSGSTVSGTVTVAGWAIDNSLTVGTAIGSVQVLVDGNVIGNASYGVNRPDVCSVYAGRLGCPNVGFTYQMNTTALAPGAHTLTVIAVDTDGTPDSGSANITIIH